MPKCGVRVSLAFPASVESSDEERRGEMQLQASRSSPVCEDHLHEGLQQLQPGPAQGLGPGDRVAAAGEELAPPPACLAGGTLASSCGPTSVFDLVKVIDAHRSSVRCLFVDDLHFLSADVDGQVMAWSRASRVNRCLMTFKHPK